jgi:hypothetical protein
MSKSPGERAILPSSSKGQLSYIKDRFNQIVNEYEQQYQSRRFAERSITQNHKKKERLFK